MPIFLPGRVTREKYRRDAAGWGSRSLACSACVDMSRASSQALHESARAENRYIMTIKQGAIRMAFGLKA